MTTLYIRDGESFEKASSTLILDRAQALISQRFRVGAHVFNSPETMKQFLQLKLAHLEYEVFCAIFLDSHHRLIEYVELFRGTVDSAQVYPREVIKAALARNASAVIFAHCHPSGLCQPSNADEVMTRRLREALLLVDVRVLDHFIVAQSGTFSFADHGML